MEQATARIPEEPEETKTEPTQAAAKVEPEKPGWFRRALSYWPWVVGGVVAFAAGVATHSYFTAPDGDELE